MPRIRTNKDGSPRRKPGPKPGSTRRQSLRVPIPTVEETGLDLDDLDELLGLPPSPAPEVGIPAGGKLLIEDVYRGVGITWLSQAFKMDPMTVKKRLVHCPALAMDRTSKVYSLRQAAGYLVEPKVDIAAYLKAMRPNDLPPMLQDSFWSAQNKRLKWEQDAGQLWHTDDVVEVLGEAARRIRTAVTLWSDNLDRVHGLSNEQRRMLTGMCDGLLDEIHETLVDMPKSKRTSSQITQLSDMEGDQASRVEDISVPVTLS